MRIFIAILIIAILGIGGYFLITGSSKFSPEKYNQQVEDVSKIEKSNPVKFLSLEASAKRTLLGVGTKFKISGSITSKSNATTFNEIELLLEFISKDGAVLNSLDYTLHQTIKPNSSINFDFKIEKPADAEDVRCSITNAKAE
jgi:hypothetical protein